jgi:radical SAM protein with 4Fe4S-binding SPASM domain
VNTREAKGILDMLYRQGIAWLCFTGGDPLTRSDFPELYVYAKKKGFIVVIFTNAYSMHTEIIRYLKRMPPFVIEITLNAATEDLYEKISRVNGSFSQTMKGIELIVRAGLPLKIKTQVMKDNLAELPKIKEIIEKWDLRFTPYIALNAALNKDATPCSSRIPPHEVFALYTLGYPLKEDCRPSTQSGLFPCSIYSGDAVYLDPYGNLVPCVCIRRPKANVLQEGIERARQRLLVWLRSKNLSGGSVCRRCAIRNICYSCPGKAWLEKGSLYAKVDWFCELAHLVHNRRFRSN